MLSAVLFFLIGCYSKTRIRYSEITVHKYAEIFFVWFGSYNRDLVNAANQKSLVLGKNNLLNLETAKSESLY